MTDTDRREDSQLKNCLKEAYGLSDEQLLREMEEAEKTLTDSDFAGAEKRIYNRIKELEAGKELEGTFQVPKGNCGQKATSVRRKKKVILAVALVAVFVSGVGISAVGGKHHFFRQKEYDGGVIIFDNDKMKEDVSNGEKAYEKIGEELGVPVLKLSYLPKEMKYDSYKVEGTKVTMEFLLGGERFYLVQNVKEAETSIGVSANRENAQSVYNKWLDREIEYHYQKLADGKIEYAADFAVENATYHIFGIIDEENFIKILENVNFY